MNGNNGDTAALSRELSLSLANVANPDRAGYHSYDSLLKDFDKLSESNPGYMQKVVVGKSPEGRDIVAYKVTEGLLDEFGEQRVRDTPISEAAFTGVKAAFTFQG